MVSYGTDWQPGVKANGEGYKAGKRKRWLK